MKKLVLFLFLITHIINQTFAQKNKKKVIDDAPAALKAKIFAKAEAIESKVVAWRRDFHQYPELSNREYKTAEKVANHLRSLGIEVQTGIAKTGVVGLLKGGKPGPVIALRADMDALPVKERADIPFASKVMGEYNGQPVPVMHACGHDTHMAILMGVAEVLSANKADLKGTIKFIFQPAEEGVPDGELGGAEQMVIEGVMENPKVDVVFGLHINAQTNVGKITYKPEGTLAAADIFKIKIKGKQTHGAYSFLGVDPIVTGAEIVNVLQTIVSRNVNLTENAATVSVGIFNAGVRNNIIPEEANLTGTIRTLSIADQDLVHKRIREIAVNIAESAGAVAEVEIIKVCPVTFNDVALTELMLPTLKSVAGDKNVELRKAVLGAEDFAFYNLKAPSLFIFLGGKAINTPDEKAAAHHTPDFFIDESGFTLGVKAMSMLAVEYADKAAIQK
jgi:amidohydrolase